MAWLLGSAEATGKALLYLQVFEALHNGILVQSAGAVKVIHAHISLLGLCEASVKAVLTEHDCTLQHDATMFID